MQVQSQVLPVGDHAVTQSAAHENNRDVRIRALNDRLRQTLTGGRIMISSAVQSLDDTNRAELLRLIQAFDAFDAGNDPYGEHDFGRVELDGTGYYFKIDYYDRSLEFGSPDPANDTVTTRVITIMREDEY